MNIVKKLTFLFLGASVMLVSGLQAQTATAYTDPVGFTTLPIKGSSTNILGINLIKKAARGSIESVVGQEITFDQLDLSGYVDTEDSYYMEITSGANVGVNAPILSFTSNSIIISDNIEDRFNGDVSSLLDAGVNILKQWTIGDVFGASNEAGLHEGFSVTQADEIRIMRPGEADRRYFYSEGGPFGEGWREFSQPGVDQANTPLYQTDGILLFRKLAEDLSVKIVGDVKITSNAVIGFSPGINVVANIYPGSNRSLSDLRLVEQGIVAGAVSNQNADRVYVQDDSGNLVPYFYSTGGPFGVGWRSFSGGATSMDDVLIKSGTGYIVVRRSATTTDSFDDGNPVAFE